jgi:diaminopimelate epimerase
MNDVSNIETGDNFIYMNTGSPHYVRFVDEVEHLDVYECGREVRYNKRFKLEGTNVNFVEPKKEALYVRTYERGVENETHSCGTGVTAAALAMAVKKGVQGDGAYEINTLGGNLKVHFTESKGEFKKIWLEGPATLVYKGEWNG